MHNRLTIRAGMLTLALVLTWASAGWATVDSLNGITGTGTSTGSMEGTMRMTRRTMPTGASKQVDSARAIVSNTYINDDSGYSKIVIYEWDSSYVGQSDSLKMVFTSGTTRMFSWTFSSPKPTLVGDTSYIFGTWSAAIANNVVNQRLTATGQSQEYWTYTNTWPTPNNPFTATRQGTAAYVQVALYYSDLPATSVKPRRRRTIIDLDGIGWILWKDAPQRFLWPHCQGMFAGGWQNEVAP